MTTVNAEAIGLQFKFMKEQFDLNKEDNNKRFDKIDSRFDWLEKLIRESFLALPDTYATLSDHAKNENRIKELEDDKKAIIKWILWSAITIISAWIATAKILL